MYLLTSGPIYLLNHWILSAVTVAFFSVPRGVLGQPSQALIRGVGEAAASEGPSAWAELDSKGTPSLPPTFITASDAEAQGALASSPFPASLRARKALAQVPLFIHLFIFKAPTVVDRVLKRTPFGPTWPQQATASRHLQPDRLCPRGCEGVTSSELLLFAPARPLLDQA